MVRGDQRGARGWRWLSLLGSAVAIGCAGELDNPGAFDLGGGGSTGATVDAVFETSCGRSTCHNAADLAGNLDLVSPGVAERTVGVAVSNADCSTQTLVIAGDPDGSYLLRKIVNAPGICGAQMPIEMPLDPTDTAVIEQWIIDLGGGSNNEAPDDGS